MKLNKISYKRVEEQTGRGFDILTNDAPSKPNVPDEFNYMKAPEKAWDYLEPTVVATNDNNANNSNFDFAATNFGTRARRLNTNLASQTPAEEAAKVPSSHRSQMKSASCAPASAASKKAPSEAPAASVKASEKAMSSHPSYANSLNERGSDIHITKPAASNASARPPMSNASQKPSAHQSAVLAASARSKTNPGSVRSIRSGGFAKLGAALVGSEKN